eukprot:gnl/MRDRNA2_/MRDRNA2_74859_c0_seq1.p1 gnl/MRDRNA2_/MRDRNA2_74859_c0~~gnl/MRDRNA2_/MRDRNA2_74859_c0_seq1.p1  ORF type:complete len:346 (-),score=65.93 gnl/MRDRNA2_/MRDRNA2_74859_c0_seq1:101-1138(-)
MQSYMWKLLIVQLITGCYGLKISGEDDPKSEVLTKIGAVSHPECPDVVHNTKSVLFWGMLLDGKDHKQGRNAYDWHGFEDAFRALKYLLRKDPDAPLSYDLLMKARKIVEENQPPSEHFGWAGTKSARYEANIFKAYTCLECEHMKTLINDVPQKFFNITRGKNEHNNSTEGCPDYASVFLMPKKEEDTQTLLKELIQQYNMDMEQLTEKTEKLARLASFLKDFAFLHPWGNGNGRFRCLMLNREIRRHRLGCGAFMYNNNKDLYYITKEVYQQKIEEGIAMYNKAIADGKSPWLHPKTVILHKQRFHPDKTMPGLTKCRTTEWKRGSFQFGKTPESVSDLSDFE